MRNPYAAALAGTLAGILAEASAWALRSGIAGEGKLWDFVVVVAFLYGPGSLLLAVPFSHALQDQVDRGTSRGRVLALGALGGIPLALVNHAAVGLILHLAYPAFGIGLSTLSGIAASAPGGAALGLGCAGWMSRPDKE